MPPSSTEQEKNFRALLSYLGFEKDLLDIYEKFFPDFNVSLRVDFSHKKLEYPSSIKGRERNNNFNAPENFVVFECVCRLLTQGYRPEDIELEREWHLGHNAKSGRADICVNDQDGTTLFIIECKTWGREFDKAFRDTKENGAQLFSYWQQEQSCKWLVLYASRFKDGKLDYQSPTISCTDDKNNILLVQHDSSKKIYLNAHNVKERFEVWDETYKKYFYNDLIFSPDSTAYKIEIKPLRKKDLKEFGTDDGIINQFEEILRHNNVSDKENAFNRLIALFIAKFVDEELKHDNDIVDFQYRQGTDSYEKLQDRLQRLHRDGMKEFMKEEIFYVKPEYAELLFTQYHGQDRKNAIEELNDTIRKLKFYSNNDFAFKDVHNEKLFFQNGKILVEMVQLFEKYKIVYPSKHQLLGDLFEQLLNKGFKQNEGQFFTPMPITRFIWDCLPLEKIIKTEKGIKYPKVIDYACGAGHFLTEAIEAVNYFAKSGGDNSWVRDSIYGIEKDYRLARVAKISLFMNGAGEGNIIFGDGLENSPDKGIANETFDILVANPPYSVKYFKGHLPESLLKNFALADSISNNAGEIETLFVERIAQLLKPCGWAAVILPSSILSNDSASYTGAREEILKNFYLRGVVQFGSKTFGATGTNTVVMFLEKFNEPPKKSALYSDSVHAILGGSEAALWEDKKILEAYTAQIGLNEEIYKNFLRGSYSLEELAEVEYFKMYVKAFADSQDAKNIKAKKFATPDEQSAAYFEKFYSYVQKIEREKLLYFALVYRQKTVVITSPADNKDQKDFLGYDWSNRKGNEGIQIIKPGGKLYNDKDRSAEGTLASIVRKNFEGLAPEISEDLGAYASFVNTKDMLDFSRVSFSKTIRLSATKSINLNTKYELKSIADIFPVIETGSRPEGGVEYISEGVLSLGGEHIDNVSGYIRLDSPKYIPVDFYNSKENGRVEKDDILICKDGARTGKVALVRDELDEQPAMLNEHVFLLRSGNTLIQYYVFQVLYSPTGQALLKSYISGAAQGGLNRTNLKQIKIPVPPEAIIKKIIDECQAIDDEYNSTRMSIESYRKKIEELFNKLDIISLGGGCEVMLESLLMPIVGSKNKIPQSAIKERGNIPVITQAQEVFISGYADDVEAITDLPLIVFGDHTCVFKYVDFNFVRGADGTQLLKIDESVAKTKYIYYYLRNIEIVNNGKYERHLKYLYTTQIPVPPLEVQEEIVAQVEALEEKIAACEKILASLEGKTAEILNRYLN
ncbi:MAG: N-6 DNA methylase [Synergistaceae bacterium]|nr:N-6 DNA methylase [Synergistaceae bacterium]